MCNITMCNITMVLCAANRYSTMFWNEFQSREVLSFVIFTNTWPLSVVYSFYSDGHLCIFVDQLVNLFFFYRWCSLLLRFIFNLWVMLSFCFWLHHTSKKPSHQSVFCPTSECVLYFKLQHTFLNWSRKPQNSFSKTRLTIDFRDHISLIQ